MRYRKCARGYVFMTNKQQDKQLHEDQAFIDSLYEELAVETDKPKQEQPSEQLDLRILAAAHKAVASKPTLQNKPQNKKNRNWFYPIATAASAILMITVVGHQIYSPVTENFEMPLSLTDSVVSSDSNRQTFSTNEITEMDTSFFEPQLASEASFVSEEERATTGKHAVKMQAPAEKQITLKASQQAKQSKAKRSSMKQDAEITAKKRMQEKQKVYPATKPIPLTKQQYLALKSESEQQSLYWTLLLETEANYIIELQHFDNQKSYYLLHKQKFQLNNTKKSAPKLFSEIQLQ